MASSGRARALQAYAGMGAFTVIWVGQLATMVGSAMTRFAFIFTVYRVSGRATDVTLVTLASFLPKILLSPVAGALVDRIPAKLALALTDTGGGCSVALAVVLSTTGHLHTPEIYAVAALAGTFEAFQYPAFSASLVTMVRPDQLSRADGMLSSAKSAADILGPLGGAAVLSALSITSVVALDSATYLLAVLAIAVTPVANRERARDDSARSVRGDTLHGLKYVMGRPELRALSLTFFVVNLAAVFGLIVIQPLVLSRTGSATDLALVVATSGLGGVVGGAIATAWAGPADKVKGLLIGIAAAGLLGQLPIAFVNPTWAIAAFVFVGSALPPIINSCNQVVWQTAVPREMLGRALGSFIFVAQIAVPLAICLAGPLADHYFKPAVGQQSGLGHVLGDVFGRAPADGLGLMLGIAGVAGAAAAAAAAMSRPLRGLGRDTAALLVSTNPATANATAIVASDAELV
jgi:DHA3 family macrolide efflux protein-like MFS transporter